MQACASQQMLPNKTRRRSKSGRRRGSKKDDPFGSAAPDDAEGVSPTLREKDMESAITMDLGAGVPYQGAPIGKQQPPPPDQPASIMAPKKEKKRHRRRRKKSTSEVDEGTETTAAPIPPEALSSGTAAGTSGTAAVPKGKGMTATGELPPRMAVVTSGPVLQGATAAAGYLLGGTQQAAPAPPPPAMAAPLGSSTAAPTAPYPPEGLPGMPATAAQQELCSGKVADFGQAIPCGSEQQAMTTRTATVAALVPPLVPPAQDIPQKIDEACSALRELAMQQRELPSADPSTSTAGGTHRTAARPSGAIRQRSPSLARMAAKLAQRPNAHMIQDDDEGSASEDEEEALFPSMRKFDRGASRIHMKDRSAQQYKLATQTPETPANAREQLSLTAGSRTVPADSLVLSPDVASKLVSVLNRVENLASGIASQSSGENVKSRYTGNATAARTNLCPKCKAAEKKQRDSAVDADQLSEDGSDEDECGVPVRRHEHKKKQRRPARAKGSKYNAHEESVEQNGWDYDEGFFWDDNERENRREYAESTGIPSRRSRSYSSLENDREAVMPEQEVRSGVMYDWIDPTDGTRSTGYMYREPPPFMRNQRFLPPYCYGGPRLEYRSYGPTIMQPPYLQPNPTLFLNSARAPLVPLANQGPYQGFRAALPPSNLGMFAQGQGYPRGPPFPARAPLAPYRYPKVSQQAGGLNGAGGQLLSGHPSAIRPIYAQQPNQAPNYSQASHNVMPASIGNASATRPYFQPPQTPQPARNVGPQTAIAALTNTAAVPSQRNMMIETMDASSTRHGGSAFSSAVKSTRQAGELFHAGTPVETEAVRTAPPHSRSSTSREERPIPAKKVIAWTMNKTAATRACRPRSVPTSPRPPEQPVPSTSSRNVSETTIACCGKCHGCAGESHSYPDDLRGASLEKILQHDDDIRWDEQLRERSRQLREERIRQEERFEQRQRMQDQERLLREERQFQADLERRREADKALQRAFERESEAEARATAAVLQILASTQDQEIARSSAGASQDNQTAAEQEDALSSSEDDAVVGSVSPTLSKPASKAGSERRCSDAGAREVHMLGQPSRTSSRKTSSEPQARRLV